MQELETWWPSMPSKRTETYRHLPLEHAGAGANVNDCVITRMHDRTLPLKLRMFLKGNVAKKSFTNNNSSDVAGGWDRPQSILELQMALANMAEVLAAVWPQDPSARILNRVMLMYEFGAAYEHNEKERCKLLEDFCDLVLRENARRAVTGGAPLSFQQAKERWRDLLELKKTTQHGKRGEQSGSGGGRGDRRGTAGRGGGNSLAAGQAGMQAAGQGGKSGVFARSTTIKFNGDLVCFHYNNAGRGCGRQARGGGCDNGRGGVYAHVCNHDYGNGSYCFAKHPRISNH
jgi:hypothetical protein